MHSKEASKDASRKRLQAEESRQKLQEEKCLERDRFWKATGGDLIMFCGYLYKKMTPLQRLQSFCDYCRIIKGPESLPVSLPAYKTIIREAVKLGIKANTSVMAVVDLLFTEKVLTQLPKYRHLLMAFTYDSLQSQRHCLEAMEIVIMNYSEELLPKVPSILYALFKHEIVEEEVILEWAKEATGEWVPKELSEDIFARAQPFVKWLEDAEVEEESSSVEPASSEPIFNDKKTTIVHRLTEKQPMDASITEENTGDYNRRNAAVMKIQKWWRSYIAAKEASRKRLEEVEIQRRKETAAVTIQQWWRSNLVGKEAFRKRLLKARKRMGSFLDYCEKIKGIEKLPNPLSVYKDMIGEALKRGILDSTAVTAATFLKWLRDAEVEEVKSCSESASKRTSFLYENAADSLTEKQLLNATNTFVASEPWPVIEFTKSAHESLMIEVPKVKKRYRKNKKKKRNKKTE